MAKFRIGGMDIVVGRNITVKGGTIHVDGKAIDQKFEGIVEIRILEGTVENVVSEAAVTCQDVSGSVTAGGSVRANNVGGDVRADGSVNCADVKGNVRADGSVKCGHIGGSVKASGSVRHG